jgi:hypothetical protein
LRRAREPQHFYDVPAEAPLRVTALVHDNPGECRHRSFPTLCTQWAGR